MAVVRVWAMINSQFCVLSDNGHGKWSLNGSIESPDGSYVCELFAEDEAGNIGYKTAILWLYDGKLTCIEWIEDKYHVRYINNETPTVAVYDEYSVTYLDTENLYLMEMLPYKYSCRYIRRGCPIND